MPSPYIKFFSKDEGIFTSSSSATVAALVGFAKKGPIMQPTLITDKQTFQKIFGLTPREFPYSHLAAYKYFEQGSNLLFTRIAGNTAEETVGRVLTNNGNGVAAILTSTNTIVDAAFSEGEIYGVKINVEIAGHDYEDTILITMPPTATINQFINEFNIAISNSSILTGKILAYGTDSTGQNTGNYFTLKTINTGIDDSLIITNPDTGNSLISNGTFGFAYTSQEAYGSYSSPTKAVVTGDIAISTSGVNLTTNKNLNIRLENDDETYTIDLASKDQATAIGNTLTSTNSGTITNGFNPTVYNIIANIDGIDYEIDLTSNMGASATQGYQTISKKSPISSTLSGLSRYGKCGFGGTTLLASTSTALAVATTYEFDISIPTVDLGNGVGSPVTIVILTGATIPTVQQLIDLIKIELDLITSLVGKYTLEVVSGDIVLQLTTGMENKTVLIDNTSGGGTDLFTAGVFTGLDSTLTQKVPTYEINLKIDNGATTPFTIDGSTDISTIAGMVSALDTAISANNCNCVFVQPNATEPNTGFKAGSKGALIIYSQSKGTENTQSSITMTDGTLVPSTKQPLLTLTQISAFNLPATTSPGKKDGVDVVITQTKALSAINTAILGKGIAFFNNGYLNVKTNTYGTLGSAGINNGSSSSALSFFSTTPISKLGGESVTIDKIINAINEVLNEERNTTNIEYAYTNPNNNLIISSNLTGKNDAKVWINSDDGITETAPVNNAYVTVFSSLVWSTDKAISVGNDGTVNGMFKFIFKEKGTASSYISSSKGCYVNFSTRKNPLYLGYGDTTNQQYYKDIAIYYDGVEVEKFEDISFDVTKSNWILSVINATPENGGSEYISIEWYEADSDSILDEDESFSPSLPTIGVYLVPDGNVSLTGGNDGILETGFDSLFLEGINTFSNVDLYDPHLLATPGVSSSAVINGARNFIEGPYRQDILFIVDPPFGLTVQEAADWHNGKSKLPGAPATAINSEFLTAYWSWVKIYDTDNNEYVWVPPSVVMMGKFTQIDNEFKPYAIPAGTARGNVAVDDYEYSPKQTEMDLMYDINGNLSLNPFVNFPGQGLIIWGQKTLYRQLSPRNRLNVERMLIYAKKLVRNVLKRYMFEPNVPTTWNNLTKEMNNIFEPMKQEGGLVNYQVIFDSTTTTPSDQNQHLLKGRIRLQSPSSIEGIEVTFSTAGADVTFG